MSFGFLLKITTLFGLSFMLIGGINAALLLKHDFNPVEVNITPTRPSALAQSEQLDLPNLSADNLVISTKTPNGRYLVGTPIELTCKVTKTGGYEKIKVLSVIRSQYNEFLSETNEFSNDKPEHTIKATFTPEIGGIVHIACRTDVDNKVRELNESDNRASTTLYIMEE